MSEDRLGPFKTGEFDGRPVGAMSLDDRRRMVRRFTYEQCRQAMKVPGLQLGVIHALEKRIRELRRAGEAPASAGEILSEIQEHKHE